MAAIDHQALKLAMDRTGMTNRQLADTLGFKESYVRNIVGGHRRLKREPATRRRIADALGVPIHWIETREDEAA